MNDLEVDMDELEARLYGQVYHVSSNNEDFMPNQKPTNDDCVKTFPRYFEDRTPQQQQNQTHCCERIGLYPVSVINPPVNNFVVFSSPPAHFPPANDSQRWLENILERCEKTLQRKKKKNLRRRVRWKHTLQTRKERKGLLKLSKPTATVVCTPKEESVQVIDDSDTNMSDVILVETTNEIISVDCEDAESEHSCKENSVCEDSPNANLSTKSCLSPIKSRDHPETASSNSSTIDYTENFKGNKVLSDFNVHTSNSFSQMNLDSFTDYMECNGKTIGTILSSKPINQINIGTNQIEKSLFDNISDSSFESEYENELSITINDSGKDIDTKVEKLPISTEQVMNDDCVIVNTVTKVETDFSQNSTTSVIELDSSTSEDNKQENDFFFIDDENSMSSIELFLDDTDKGIVNSTKILNVEENVIDFTLINEIKKPTSFSDYWTDDMNKFYRDSWGQEEFSVVEQQRQMSDDPNMWRIIPNDEVNINYQQKQPRCRRCREFGHISQKCIKKLPAPKCILCGVSGHFESRCPDKLCTSCGRKSHYFTTYCSACATTRRVVCSVCSMQGHTRYKCPDLWRRYLFTTKEGRVMPQPIGAELKRAEDQWCSGCGNNGHFEQNCHYYNRTHLPSSVQIYDYSDVYVHKSGLNQNCGDSKKSDDNNDVNGVERNDRNLFFWKLTPKEENKLTEHGSTFLVTLEKTLGVKAKVKGSNCYLLGSKRKRVKAKAAIQRYCTNFDLVKQNQMQNFMFKTNLCNKENIQINFDYLQNDTINWRHTGTAIYNKILNNSHNRCKDLYKKLNAIIQAKLLFGNAKEHMRVLENYLQENVDSVKRSFNHIFNSGNNLFFDYYSLINRLPNEEYYSNQLIVETWKRSILKMCNLPEYQEVNKYYDLVIIKNYSPESMTEFKNQVDALLSNNDALKIVKTKNRNPKKFFSRY